jgi:hypothetical protein
LHIWPGNTGPGVGFVVTVDVLFDSYEIILEHVGVEVARKEILALVFDLFS